MIAVSAVLKTPSGAPTDLPSYRQTAEEVLGKLNVDGEQGLPQDETQRRRQQHGPNELTAEKPVPAWRKFLEQFENPLVLLLLAAAIISAALWLFERDKALPYEAIAILAVV